MINGGKIDWGATILGGMSFGNRQKVDSFEYFSQFKVWLSRNFQDFDSFEISHLISKKRRDFLTYLSPLGDRNRLFWLFTHS